MRTRCPIASTMSFTSAGMSGGVGKDGTPALCLTQVEPKGRVKQRFMP